MNTTQKSALLMSLGLITVIAVFALGKVAGSDIKKLRDHKVTLSGLQLDLANLDTILSDRQTYGSRINSVVGSLPKSYPEVAQAISVVERVADDSDVAVSFAIEDEPMKDNSGLRTIGIEISATGTYANMTRFISTLSRIKYHTAIESLGIEPEEGKLTGTVKLKLFIQ